ncbi:MAG: hypothetical protein PHQ35_05300 [Phycisphaerae bacterium]|nr:hypothetical protein [Phycisphaerae bacterium]MDD5380867.1 hypothetical protein [Phycisphaerae bacterium]
MSKLVKSIRNFVVRDITYIVGGLSVILSFLYVWGKIDISKKAINITIIPESANIIFYVIGFGLAYAVGYCFQEIFSLLHIVKTADYFRPRFPLRWLYRCLIGEKWEDVFPDIPKGRNRRWEVTKRLRRANIMINEKASPDDKIHREWMSSFIMVCTTLGPCAMVTGLLLLWKGIPTFFRNNLDIYAAVKPYIGNSPELVFLGVLAFLTVMILTRLSVFLIPFAFVALVMYSKKITFDIALALSVVLISMALITLGWIKGLELMKNTETLYHRKLRDYIP